MTNPTTMTKNDPHVAALSAEREQGVKPLDFKKVQDYTTFDAEYAFDRNDIVFHFFPPHANEVTRQYWLSQFPAVLDKFAQKFWEVEYPRLMAAYTEELNSWWLRAFGFGNQGDPEARALKFIEQLDAELENINQR